MDVANLNPQKTFQRFISTTITNQVNQINQIFKSAKINILDFLTFSFVNVDKGDGKGYEVAHWKGLGYCGTPMAPPLILHIGWSIVRIKYKVQKLGGAISELISEITSDITLEIISKW